jgi:hypothetical protein
MVALLYFGLKFAAYCAWMYLGLRTINKDRNTTAFLAYGCGRLLLGIFFGALIYFLSALLLSKFGYGFAQNLATYLAVYVPVRWVEWSIFAALISHISFAEFVVGASKPDRLWRIGGIVISCLADIPLIISFGGVIPTGRFLC